MKRIDLAGKRFGKLVAISCAATKSGIVWTCKCDCGKITKSTTSKLRKGVRFSCGCSRKKPFGEASLNKLYDSYRRGACKRGTTFELKIEEFTALTLNRCHYCGSEPSAVMNSNDARINRLGEKYKFNGDYIYNGIDRVDNNLGYSRSNCVPCCKICNRAKSEMSLKEFEKWIKNLCQHQKDLSHM